MKSSFSAIADVTNHTVRIPPAGGQRSNMPTTQAKTIDGRACTVRQLLANARYTIDFYQREYAWKERQVRELIDDLTGRFLDFYDSDHEWSDVEDYGHYFLGSIVISNKRKKRFIVDGQQRLTSLTLLLIHLYHLQQDRSQSVDVQGLIYSQKYGRKSFNLDVPDRTEVMQRLLDGEPIDKDSISGSIRNIADQYDNICEHLPDEVTGEALPFYVDWLLENVHLVEIEAYSDEDAYTIFETMNDRGLSLSLPEMLKGYILANVRNEDDQKVVNSIWKSHMETLKKLGDEEEVDFFKNWLRAKHAKTIRPGRKGAENRDYERIGSEFHRWVRDQRESLGLTRSNAVVKFVKRDLDFYARNSMKIRSAAGSIEPDSGWESIRYNDDRGFSLQTQTLLAAIDPRDDSNMIHKKIALVADYLDIWLARRVWNFRTISYSSVKYTLFNLTKELRGRNVEDLSQFLREQLEQQSESFASAPKFRLHNQNHRQVRHILARLTHWVDTQCKLPSRFEDLVAKGRARPFEIEHIWADHYDRFKNVFKHPNDFEIERGRIGGLILLQRGLNQSLGDARYEEKRSAYLAHSQNLLARSLHPLAYHNLPIFRSFRDRTGLPFRHYESFGVEEQAERQELYIRIAEWVWNPSRLDLDGEQPPTPEPIAEPEEEGGNRPDRQKARRAFWERLLVHANQVSDLHSRISPNRFHWVGTRRHGQWWNYVVLQYQTRAELYIDAPEAEVNKKLFDTLYADRETIEAEFGGELVWQRLDEKRACRISFTVPGGWVDNSTWQSAIQKVVDAMQRLYKSLSNRT